MGQQLQELVRQVDIILVPVLPSPIDIHAATRFIEELLLVGKVRSFGVQVAVIANRAKQRPLYLVDSFKQAEVLSTSPREYKLANINDTTRSETVASYHHAKQIP
ncbi:hypothetical protein MNBD_GAMMA21-1459 [hydrothermal vent metagenome]|uniref:Uncharacterized protein n=1 Tax=hydrothermal vent metagenome TaxID=652676 RepID=A0A3B1A6V1_9ZZZZ